MRQERKNKEGWKKERKERIKEKKEERKMGSCRSKQI